MVESRGNAGLHSRLTLTAWPHIRADMRPLVILLQPTAPIKPAAGATCNGCGVCCSFAPCPLGALLSRRSHGACAALQWQDDSGLYRCGVLADPRRWLPWLPAAWARGLARRWISAASGCDSNLSVG